MTYRRELSRKWAILDSNLTRIAPERQLPTVRAAQNPAQLGHGHAPTTLIWPRF